MTNENERSVQTNLALSKQIDLLTDEVLLLMGAIKAQDDREMAAGVLCGVSYDLHGCDWPSAVAEELNYVRGSNIDLQREIAALKDQLRLANIDCFYEWPKEVEEEGEQMTEDIIEKLTKDVESLTNENERSVQTNLALSKQIDLLVDRHEETLNFTTTSGLIKETTNE